MSEVVLTLRDGNYNMHYTTGGKEHVSNDLFDMANFIDKQLDYQLKKAKGAIVDESSVGLNNTKWIDE